MSLSPIDKNHPANLLTDESTNWPTVWCRLWYRLRIFADKFNLTYYWSIVCSMCCTLLTDTKDKRRRNKIHLAWYPAPQSISALRFTQPRENKSNPLIVVLQLRALFQNLFTFPEFFKNSNFPHIIEIRLLVFHKVNRLKRPKKKFIKTR